MCLSNSIGNSKLWKVIIAKIRWPLSRIFQVWVDHSQIKCWSRRHGKEMELFLDMFLDMFLSLQVTTGDHWNQGSTLWLGTLWWKPSEGEWHSCHSSCPGWSWCASEPRQHPLAALWQPSSCWPGWASSVVKAVLFWSEGTYLKISQSIYLYSIRYINHHRSFLNLELAEFDSDTHQSLLNIPCNLSFRYL